MITIVWSAKAQEDFEYNIQYLLENWPIEVVHQFTAETEKILHMLITHPKGFQYDQQLKCYFAPVAKQISLIYEIKGKKLVLLRFWNNFQNPRKLVLPKE